MQYKCLYIWVVVGCLTPAAVMAQPTTLADLESGSTQPGTLLQKPIPQISKQSAQVIDANLAKRVYQLALESRDPAIINPYLEMISRFNNSNASEKDIIAYRAKFYEQQLGQLPTADVNEAMYYNLAQSYSYIGDKPATARTLARLLQAFPNSQYSTESNFRIAEINFAIREYVTAQQFYQRVINSKEPLLLQQSLYGLAWSYYKNDQYSQSLPILNNLVNYIQQKPSKSKGDLALLEDSFNTLGLVFVQMGGAPALAEYYSQAALSANEVRVYREVLERYSKQKQELEIANTYQGFIDKRPLAPETAEFSIKLIELYTSVGYANDVIRSKSEFIQRFATGGRYYQQADSTLKATLITALKTHTADLAAHYHAVALQNKQKQAFITAANMYGSLVDLTDVVAEKTIINEKLANLLYQGGEYERAIAYFNTLAYSPQAQLRSSNPENAGFFAWQAYQTLRTNSAPTAQRAWLDQQKESTFSYAKAFGSSSVQAYDLLSAMAGEYVALKDYATVVQISERTLAVGAINAGQKRDTTILRANALYDLKQWDKAALAYKDVLALANITPEQRTTYSNQLAATYYEQAVVAEAGKDLARASALFADASATTYVPDIKIDALYQSASVWGTEPQAIDKLLQFYQAYPAVEQSQGLPERVVQLQEKYLRFKDAATTYLTIYERDYLSKNDNALNALWLAAENERKVSTNNGQLPQQPSSADELRLYNKYLAEPKAKLPLLMTASYRMQQHAKLNNLQGDVAAAHNRHWGWYSSYTAAKQTYLDAEDNQQLRYLAASARAYLDAPLVANYMRLPITQPLRDSIAAKKLALQSVITTQQTLIDLTVAEYVTQGYYTLGAAYTNFYQGVLAAPKPADFDELELEQYDLALEEQTEPIKEKALDFHKRNVQLAYDKKKPLWDEWVAKSFDTLADISAGLYNRKVTAPVPLAGDQALVQLAAQLNQPALQSFAAGEALKAYVPGLEQLIASRQLGDGYLAERSRSKALAETGVDVPGIKLAQAYWYRARVAMYMANFTLAKQLLGKALVLDGKMSEAHLQLAAINDVYLNDKNAALNGYLQANSISPDNKNTQKWLNVAEKELQLPLTKFAKKAAPVVAVAPEVLPNEEPLQLGALPPEAEADLYEVSPSNGAP